MEKMKITFGDYWDDGHGKYTTLDIFCNKSVDELFQIEIEAERKTGYRFQTNNVNKFNTIALFNKYEENDISDENLKDLVDQGLDNTVVVRGKTYPLYPFENGDNDFAEFFMRWLRLADHSLQWRWPDKEEETPHAIFNCRGYGLYF